MREKGGKRGELLTRDRATGPHATEIDHHPPREGDATAEYTDTSERDTRADEECDGVY